MKRLLFALLAGAILLEAAPVQVRAEAPPNPTVILDGLPLQFDVAPMLVNGRTMVPFRAIAEALNVNVHWNNDTRTITATEPDREVRLTIDDTTATVNGEAYTLDVPPIIVSSRTLVPLRFFSEAFDAHVEWNGNLRQVTIVSPVRPMRILGFYAIRSFGERHYVPDMSHAAYGWASLTAEGRVTLTENPDFDWPEPAGEITAERLLEDARQAGTRRYLMIHKTDVDGALTRLVLDEQRILAMAADTAAIVREKGFDGALLDFEGLGLTETGEELQRVRNGFTRLVQAVAQEMRLQGKETIVSVHAPNGAYHGYDYAAIAREATFLQVMVHDYGQSGVFEPEPVDRVIEGLEMAVEQVGPDKVIMGILFTHETPETMWQKVGLAKRYGVAGISVWRLGEVGEEAMRVLRSTVTPLK